MAGVAREPVADGGHGMLAHAEVDVAAQVAVFLEGTAAGDVRERGVAEIRAAADQAGDRARQRLDDLLAALARRELRAGELRGPLHMLGNIAEIRIDARGERLAARAEHARIPRLARRFALAIARLQVLVHGRRHGEARLGIEADGQLGRRHFIGAEGRAMHLRRARHLRRTKADRRAALDERRAARVGNRGAQGVVDRGHVVAIDLRHLPAVRGKARRDVFGERDLGRAVDADVVVVVEDDEAPQAEVAGERGGLRGDAFHQAAVAGDDVGVVVAQICAIFFAKPSLGDRHADAVGEALAQRTRRRLDAGRVAALRVARRLAAQLPELPQIIERQRVAVEVQQRVLQHRAVSRRKDEAIAVRPIRRGRVELEEARPQHVGDVRHAERHPGVPGVGGLDAVDGQATNRGGAQGIEGELRLNVHGGLAS